MDYIWGKVSTGQISFLLSFAVAVETKADLAILMSDVDGIYDKPPAFENARVMHTFNPKDLNIIECVHHIAV